MPRYIHPVDGRVFACPECDHAGEVYRRRHTNKDFDHEFRCHKCGAEFDTPVERESRNVGGRTAVDDDGLPASLSDKAKELIRSGRGS